MFTELPCSGDLGKSRSTPGPTSDSCVNRGYLCLVACISAISSCFMFSRSRNLLFTVSPSYRIRVTFKIRVNFRFCRYSMVLWATWGKQRGWISIISPHQLCQPPRSVHYQNGKERMSWNEQSGIQQLRGYVGMGFSYEMEWMEWPISLPKQRTDYIRTQWLYKSLIN